MIDAVQIKCWNHDEPLLVSWVDRVKPVPGFGRRDSKNLAKIVSLRAAAKMKEMAAQGARWQVRLMDDLKGRDGLHLKMNRAHEKGLVGTDTLTADDQVKNDEPVPDGGRGRHRFTCGDCGQHVPILQENLDALIDAFVAQDCAVIPLGALRKHAKYS